MRLSKYLKAAFVQPWNLLAFLGGIGLSFALGGQAGDVVLPLVFAGEVAYLGLLGTHPKFQAYVDARDAKSARVEDTARQETLLNQIWQALPRKAQSRFEALRARCIELRQITQGMKHPGDDVGQPLDSLQVAGLDRLLWIYLRMLYTQTSLERFFATTSEDAIASDIERHETRLKQLPPATDNPQQEKARRTIEDTLQTSRDRLANFKRAKETYDQVQLEIERLESKIQSLGELAVNRQEPDYISGQVDQVAASMKETEKSMNDLQFATGLSPLDDSPPSLVQRQNVTLRGG